MNTCTNCGATLRPGAKFCTTCGTRLNESSSTTDGWGAPRPDAAEDSQATTVLNVVNPPISKKPEPRISEPSQRSAEAWSSAYSAPKSNAGTNDPASRFISALDKEVEPVTEAAATTDDAPSTWGSAPSVFTPPPPSTWSYSATLEDTNTASEVTDDAAEMDDAVLSTWGVSTTATDQDTKNVDEPEPSVEIQNEDMAEPDANGSQEAEPELSPEDARTRAIELADELRRTIRMMSSGGMADESRAVTTLTNASMAVGDFSDVRGMITAVNDDPRDIHTLGDLAGKIDRIEELLNEHTALSEAINTAIKELHG